MVCVDLTDEELSIARERANARMTAGLYNRFYSTDAERLKRAITGALGEVAFEKVLIRSGVTFRCDLDSSAGPDDGDFFVQVGASELTVDVKIAETLRETLPSWRFGVPFDQIPSDKDVIVIGYWNPTTNRVCFWGSVEGRSVVNRPVVRENSFSGRPYFTSNQEVRWGELSSTFAPLPPLR